MCKNNDPLTSRWRHVFDRPLRCRKRRGYLYVAVLATTTVVSLIALCAIQVARVELRIATEGQNWHSARQLAQSGIELAIAVLTSDTNWKRNYAFNVEHPSPAVPLDGGTVTWMVRDLGGGNVRIDGIGRKGRARCVLCVDAQYSERSPLEVGVVGNVGVTLDSASEKLVISESSVATHGTLTNYGTIVGNCESKTHVGNLPVGRTVSPGPIRTVADEQLVFSYYLANGTDITEAVSTSSYRIRRVVLSPRVNPYGQKNSQGIYVVKLPPWQTLTIEESRIVGTLVVTNATGGVEVKGPVNWEAAYANYPALLVQGSLTLSLSGTQLEEARTLVNFNPNSTPWQATSDNTMDDVYPTGLAGLIYCSGNATFDGKNTSPTMDLQGVLLANGTCRLRNTANVVFKYSNAALDSPPPGFEKFTAPRLGIGSWRQIPSY